MPDSQGCQISTSPSLPRVRSRYRYACQAASFGASSSRNALAHGLPTAGRRAMPQWRESAAGRCRMSRAPPEHPATFSPEVRAWEVAPVAPREDDVRQESVTPLAGEQRAKLRLGAVLVPACIPHRDTRRVPAPLVRIQARRRLRRMPEPVRVEHPQGAAGEVRLALGDASLRLYGRRACPSGTPTRFVIAL